MKKQTFFKGSLILMASAAAAKILGALFKVPLTNILGGTGMGYFSCAYGLFLPIYSLSVTGLTAAVAKNTAEEAAKGCFGNVRRIRTVSRLMFTALGALLTLIIILAAKPFTLFTAGDENPLYAILMIAPSAMLGCMTAVERGYYEGLRNMYPTAISQAVEAAVKAVAGLWLAGEVLAHEREVLSLLPNGTDIMSAAAAAAVLGVTLSTAAGLLYMIIRNTFGDGIKKSDICGYRHTYRETASRLIKTMLPIALGTIAASLTSVIDLCTVMRCIDNTCKRFPEAMAVTFGEIAREPVFPAFVYGSFTGMALTVFNLVPSVTNMFGKAALPCTARAYAKGRTDAVKAQVCSVSLAAALIAFPAGAGLLVLSEPVMDVLYSSHTVEGSFAAEGLRCLVPGMVCLCITVPLFSVMQGMGRSDLPVKLTLPCVAIKLVLNLVLLSQPAFAVSGAAVSTSICYIAMLCFSLWVLSKVLNGIPGLIKTLLPSAYSAAMCGTAAFLTYSNTKALGDKISLLCSVLAGAAMYAAVMGLMGFTPKNLRERLSLRL